MSGITRTRPSSARIGGRLYAVYGPIIIQHEARVQVFLRKMREKSECGMPGVAVALRGGGRCNGAGRKRVV